MKQLWYGAALALGLTLVLSVTVLGHAGRMERDDMGGGMGMMGPYLAGAEAEAEEGETMMGPPLMPHMMHHMMRGMMHGGMRGMPRGMGMHQPSQMVRVLKVELGLSDDQTKELKDILLEATKTGIKQRADLRIAELEVRELLDAEPVDMAQVESKLKAIEGLRTAIRLESIRKHEQAKGVLTPEQRQKLERVHDRLFGMMGPGGMGSMGMMGPEMMDMRGQRGMGGMMMGPQMMQQMRRGMMGGGTGGQPQSPTQTAKAPENLTQEDAQGAVTVTATLLTADKPRADGRLAVQIKLDTHSVDLDQYQLEKLATLRDGQGREMPALGFEGASGSAHHREGILSFGGTDARGKPVLTPEAKTLTLILRGIGGVQERLFTWQLPGGPRM